MIDQNEIKKLQNIGLSYITTNNTDEDSLYLFVSYDLTNSTRFKAEEPSLWPIVYNQFYELLRRENKSNIKNINIWKYIGDEILFYKKINEPIELYSIFSEVEKIIENVISGLGNLFKEKVKILSVKSIIWITPVKYIPAQKLSEVQKIKIHNIMFHTYITSNQIQVDFLGPDIDLGFRLSKYSAKKIIVVSAELAILLQRLETPDKIDSKNDILQKLKIVDFVNLKGIWNNRYYPIIWYYKDWNKIENNFFYDDQFKDDLNIIKKAIKESIDISYLENIFKEVERLNYIDDLKNLIKRNKEKDNDTFLQVNLPPEKLSEVHCVAIIFDKKNNFFIAKRSSNKKRFKGLWEFGCGQLKTNMTFESCIKQAYKEDFAIDFDFDNQPLIPVNIYSFIDEEEQRIIPGIIFFTKINEESNNIKIQINKNKHSEYKWVSEEEFSKYDENNLVKNAKENVKKALKLLNIK